MYWVPFSIYSKESTPKSSVLSQVRCELSWSCLPAGYIFCLVDFKEPLATWRQLEENVNTHSTELFDLAVSYQCPWLATIIQPKRINNGYKLKFDEARCSTPNDNSLLLSISIRMANFITEMKATLKWISQEITKLCLEVVGIDETLLNSAHI